MSKVKYYEAQSEQDVAINKLINMNEAQATMLYGNIEQLTPPQRLLSKGGRGKTYAELGLKSLEYLWFGSTKADFRTRIASKAAYLTRTTEQNHPRLDMLFTYAENMQVCTSEELRMFPQEVIPVTPVKPPTPPKPAAVFPRLPS